jgi:hypothetical protein
MSRKQFVEFYTELYPGVKNEMMMRANAEELNCRFMFDDQVVDGAMHSIAWVIFSKEEPMLQFPETYGRQVKVVLYDVWNNVRAVYTKPGEYHLEIPGCAAGIVLATVESKEPGVDIQDYLMALDVIQNLVINDIGVGANDYEDFQTLVPAASTLNVDDPKDVSGKEFFAIANAVWEFNPFPGSARTNKARESMLIKTKRMTPSELDEIKKEALSKMNV